MQWANVGDYPFNTGDYFLGIDDQGNEIGVTPEVHAITIASSGAGKGACVIIPNIKRWNDNLLIIDPKGENATATAEDRANMGQSVYVVDPFKRANVPEELCARFNPLKALDIHAPTIAEDIKAIADGIVLRSGDPSADNWDDGAQTLIAGVIGFVLLEGDKKNLGEVRDIISEEELLKAYALKCRSDDRLGGLLKAGAGRVLAQEGQYYISNADKNTTWLDSEPVRASLSKSDFELSELKNGKASVYLVLPANYIASHGRFLRLFVRSAIEEMARPTPDGNDKGERCLFLLDEFFSLGFINEIAVSAGLMRGYGLHLWPFMQDIGQLTKLYGQDGAQTFFANADLVQFFGIKDQPTLQIASHYTGIYTPEEVGMPPVAPSNSGMGQQFGRYLSGNEKHAQTTKATGGIISALSMGSSALSQRRYNKASAEYQVQSTKINRPRVSEEQLADLLAKKEDVVTDYIFNIVKGHIPLLVKPAPYFRHEYNQEEENIETPIEVFGVPTISKIDLFGLVFGLGILYFLYQSGLFMEAIVWVNSLLS